MTAQELVILPILSLGKKPRSIGYGSKLGTRRIGWLILKISKNKIASAVPQEVSFSQHLLHNVVTWAVSSSPHGGRIQHPKRSRAEPLIQSCGQTGQTLVNALVNARWMGWFYDHQWRTCAKKMSGFFGAYPSLPWVFVKWLKPLVVHGFDLWYIQQLF